MKSSCPVCPSSDAFHIYDYGKATEHGHCFSCGYHKFSEATQHLEELTKANERHMKDIAATVPLTLPVGSEKRIDVKALQWLDKYDIIRDEIIANDIRWSDPYHWLVFPIKQNGQLVGTISRVFPKLGQTPEDIKPKWIGKGPLGNINYFVGTSIGKKSNIVLVEDIVSAIKVGRQTRAMPLFGSHLSPKRLMWLHGATDKVVFWLDRDKWHESIKFAKSCALVGLVTQVLYTDKDPKECTNEEIFNLISL